uniref:Uncharacterized protein n=1 Tax=Setaria viridis TaxID=4556 RepID=A0A4U6TDF8_SETVI|nr:hypothetical protein SEVIR_9G346900v2 [Setaria viridis]
MAATANPDCSPAAEDRENCDLFRCVCCWSKYCSPQIPRIAPGRDYIRVPSDADADDRPLWSVLVGCTSIAEPFHNLRLRLHRFRVAASGRVIGRTDDTLQPLLAVSPDDEENLFVSDATAALAPDGRRLYVLCTHSPGVGGAISSCGSPPALAALQFPVRGFAVDLGTRSLSALPPLPFSHGSYLLWAPSVETGSSDGGMRLVVRRLDDGEAAWEEAAGVDILYQPFVNSRLSGCHLQGYAVIRDRFILLSLIDSIFFSDCAAGTLTPVTTVGKSPYKPISGRAVHFGGDDDDTVYFVRGANLFAYEFSPEEGKLLAPAMEVDRLWPYYEEWSGSVVHLTGRMLCAVWINMYLPCGCAERHALITTFLVEGGHDGDGGSFVPCGVHVLHSTCRRVGMLRSSAVPRYESFDAFCFLQ